MSLGLIPRHGITGSKAMHILALVYLPQISLQKDDCSYTSSDGKDFLCSASMHWNSLYFYSLPIRHMESFF